MNLKYFFKKQSSLQRKFIASGFAAVFSAGTFGGYVGVAMNPLAQDNPAVQPNLDDPNIDKNQEVKKIKIEDLTNYENNDKPITLYIEKNYKYIHEILFGNHKSVAELLMELYKIKDESFKTAKYKKPKEMDLIFNFFKYMLQFKGSGEAVESYLDGILSDIVKNKVNFKTNLENAVQMQFPTFHKKIKEKFPGKNRLDYEEDDKDKTSNNNDRLEELKKVNMGIHVLKGRILRKNGSNTGKTGHNDSKKTELNPEKVKGILNSEKKFSFKKLVVTVGIVAIIIAVLVIVLLTRGNNISKQIDTNEGNNQQRGSDPVNGTEQDTKQGDFDEVQEQSATQGISDTATKIGNNMSKVVVPVVAATGAAGSLVGGVLIHSANKKEKTKSDTAEKTKSENNTGDSFVYFDQKSSKVDETTKVGNDGSSSNS